MAIDGTPSRRTTLRAIVQETYRTADVWRSAQVRRPKPAPDGVRIRMRAAGLGGLDT